MRALLWVVAVVLCLAAATLANEQQQQEQDEIDRQQEELRRNLRAMDLLASQTQAAADKFRAEQSLWEQSIADASQLQHEHEHHGAQEHQHIDIQQLDRQELLQPDVEPRIAPTSGFPALNETIFTEPFLLPMHQSLQFPHCFTPGNECTLAFWIWVAPQEELLNESPSHSFASIITSTLPPGLLSPSLLLGVAPQKMHPFLSINGLDNGALVGVFSHTEIEPDRWVHVALSLDGISLSLFINGKRTAIVQLPVPTPPPTCVSSMIQRGRNPPSYENISTVGNEQGGGDAANAFGWSADGCQQCQLWPFNTTLSFGGSRTAPGADAVIARAVLYNTKMDDSGAFVLHPHNYGVLLLHFFASNQIHACFPSHNSDISHYNNIYYVSCAYCCAGSHDAITDMKAMKLSRKRGSGPLVIKFPFIEHKGADDIEDEYTEDLPMVLSQEITEAGDESMFFSGNLLSNFLNATGGSSFTSPALPLLGVAFQHLLPSELREVTLPTPLSIDAINALPRRPPLPSGAGFITVSADTQAEVLCRFP